MVVVSFLMKVFRLPLFFLLVLLREFYGSFEKCFSDLSSLFVKQQKNFFLPRGSVCMGKALSICYQRLISLRKKSFLAVENNGKNHKLINYLLWIVMKEISAQWLTICRLFVLAFARFNELCEWIFLVFIDDPA